MCNYKINKSIILQQILKLSKNLHSNHSTYHTSIFYLNLIILKNHSPYICEKVLKKTKDIYVVFNYSILYKSFTLHLSLFFYIMLNII